MRSHKDNHYKNRRGEILIEAIVAISIITVGLLGTFELLSRSLSLNRVVGDQYAAANLATEGIEVVKNLIDNNLLQGSVWNTGIGNGVYEIMYNDTALVRQLSSSAADCTINFIQQNANFLMFDSATHLYGYSLPTQTNYKRAICVETMGGGDELKINSVVTWTSRGGVNLNINLEDHFFNWR
jgi:hypothetical protein